MQSAGRPAARLPAMRIRARQTANTLVTAIIRPFKRDDLREALAAMAIQGITVTEVEGFGPQRWHTELHGGAD